MKPLNFSSWQSITSFFFSVCVFFKWRAKKLAHLTHEFVLRWCNVFCFCRNLVIFFMWRTVFSSTTNFIKQLHIICLCTYTDTGSVRIPRLHACRSGYVGSVTTACFCALLMWQNRYKRNRHIGVRHIPLTMPYSCLSLPFSVCVVSVTVMSCVILHYCFLKLLKKFQWVYLDRVCSFWWYRVYNCLCEKSAYL